MATFEMSREQLWSDIRHLKRKKTLPDIREARQMLRDWMKEHPDDYSSQDAGEELWMMEEALEFLAAEKATDLIAA